MIETHGVVAGFVSSRRGGRLTIHAPKLARRVRRGASVAVNGACLSVAATRQSTLEFDVIPETLRRTTIGTLQAGDRVNLERAMRATGRLDGHIVQGHVDGTARVVQRLGTNSDTWLDVELPHPLVKYMLPKGSVALDGVSLTIGRVRTGRLRVHLIPITLQRTTLGRVQTGDRLNVEADVLVKLACQLRKNRTGSNF